jgi:hypothetical protein
VTTALYYSYRLKYHHADTGENNKGSESAPAPVPNQPANAVAAAAAAVAKRVGYQTHQQKPPPYYSQD